MVYYNDCAIEIYSYQNSAVKLYSNVISELWSFSLILEFTSFSPENLSLNSFEATYLP